jgi:putative transposase
VASGVYHVTGRGNRRQNIFVDDRDRLFFLGVLEAVVTRLAWQCHAYCLLENHYHLVIETPAPDLSVGMQRLNSEHAQWFNRRHSVGGHLFQGRFHAVLVESHGHLLHLVRYLALNPVRAGLCRDPADWRWGSFRYLTAERPTPPYLAVERVIGLFGQDVARARQRISEFVLDTGADSSSTE